MKRILFLFVAAVPFLSCSKYEPAVYPGVGDPFPEFSLGLYDGTVVSAERFRNSDVLLTFFNTGCPDCRAELPVVDSFKRKHPEKNVYAVSREESAESILEYWRSNSLELPFSPQEDRRIYSLFADSGIPYIVVGKYGVITAVFTDKDMPSLERLEAAMP